MKDVDTYCNLLNAELAKHGVELLDYNQHDSVIYLELNFKTEGIIDWFIDHSFLSALKTKPKNINVYNYLLSL